MRPQVMIHGTQAAALLSPSGTYGFVMKIVMCAEAAVVALLGDFALVRVLAVLLGVYLYGALAVNRGDLLGLRTCSTFASLASVGRLFELKDQVLTLRNLVGKLICRVRPGCHCPPVHSSSKLQQQTKRVRV